MAERRKNEQQCCTCGGTSNACLFLICDNCKDVSAHVYCMKVLPENGGLPEQWTCEDCDIKSLEDLKEKSPLIDTQISVKEKKLITPPQVGKIKYIPEGEIATAKYNGKTPLDQLKSLKIKLMTEILRDATKDKVVRKKNGTSFLFLIDKVQGKRPLDTNPNPQHEKLNTPISKAIWKGGIEYFEHVIHSHYLYAHMAQNASQKVGEIFKKLGPTQKLDLKVKSLKEAWPKAFKLYPPDQQDIGFYLFSSGTNRIKEKFIRLVERLNNSHQVLTGQSGYLHLLIFPSQVLPKNIQCINGEPYLWGLLKHHKRKKKQAQVDVGKKVHSNSRASGSEPSGGTYRESREKKGTLWFLK